MCDIFLCSGEGVGLSEFDKEILQGLGTFNKDESAKNICENKDKSRKLSGLCREREKLFHHEKTKLSCIEERVPDLSDSGIFDSSGSDAALSDVNNNKRRNVNKCSTLESSGMK